MKSRGEAQTARIPAFVGLTALAALAATLLASSVAQAAEADGSYALPALTFGANCSVSVGGKSMTAAFSGTDTSEKVTITSFTSDLFALNFRRDDENRRIAVGIDGSGTSLSIQGRDIQVLHNGLGGEAVGYLDTDTTHTNGVGHVEFDIQSSASPSLIQVLCDRVQLRNDRGLSEADSPAAQALLGVSLVSFDAPTGAVR